MADEFKRPLNHTDDPEEAYRKGYQRGAIDALQATDSLKGKFLQWTNVALQIWRHDRNASPTPPTVP